MRVLLTGHKGQLGQALLQRLETASGIWAGAAVCGVDREELDLRDYEAVSRFLLQYKPDVVFNCAAFTDVDGCESREAEGFALNALAPLHLSVAAEDCGAKLVHISTDYVFDGKGKEPYRETEIPHPVSAYGRTKLAGEAVVQAHCRRHFIVRTAWLYGHSGKNFVRTMLRFGREKGMLRVVNDQRGSPTYAGDLAERLLLLAETDAYGLYHCVGSGDCTWYDFAKEILRLGGVEAALEPCSSDEFPSPVKRPAYSVLAQDKLTRLTGVQMPYWKESLAQFFEKDEAENIWRRKGESK